VIGVVAKVNIFNIYFFSWIVLRSADTSQFS
jgi:hypothetical protein